MTRGTIVLTKFPFTDLSSAKRRPGIVVSRTVSNTNDVVVAFISSVMPSDPEATDYKLTVQHTDFPITGLKKDSIIKSDKLATINMSLISGRLDLFLRVR